MNKFVLAFAAMFYLGTASAVQAQEDDDSNIEIVIRKKIKKKNWSEAEESVADNLIKKEVDNLKTKIKDLEKQYASGNITKAELEIKKKKASEDSANKISVLLDSMVTKKHHDHDKEEEEIVIEVDESVKTCTDDKDKKRDKNDNAMSLHFGTGWNNMLDNNQKVLNKYGGDFHVGKSMYFKIAALQSKYINKKQTISFDYGLEYYTKNYRFDDDTKRIKNTEANGIEIVPITEFPNEVKKSRFNQSTLEVPLSFTFDLGDNFMVSAGMYGGFVLRSKQVIKYSGSSVEDKKRKIKSGFDTNPFQYGALFRIGKRNFNAQVRWQLNEVFSKHAPGLEAYPISFGINFGGL